MLIIVYLLDIASDITSKKEHTPLCSLSRGELDLWFKMEERISPAG